MSSESFSLWQRFTAGCWGEHARINNAYNGGPECASQVPLSFILGTVAVVTPVHLYTIKLGVSKLMEKHERKAEDLRLTNRSDPTSLEKMMSLTCLLCLLGNVYYKWHTMTLIFMFNPCHVVCAAIMVVGFSKFNLRTELLALFIFSSAFGGWIGIIFSENDEMTMPEIVIYYVEHAFSSFLGPVVLCLSGRFDPLDYAGFPLPFCGYHLFTLYMRWVLTPLSQLTWANLNHTLCGVGNDPFYEHLELGYTYYFWADFYLLFSCYVGICLNYVICLVFKKVFGEYFYATRVAVNFEKANKME